ncbi:Large ribosomal subunit protein eL19x-like protein [Drosera capensis]
MESIHKSKAEKAIEKTPSDRCDAEWPKNQAGREIKITRREERLAQDPGEKAKKLVEESQEVNLRKSKSFSLDGVACEAVIKQVKTVKQM